MFHNVLHRQMLIPLALGAFSKQGFYGDWLRCRRQTFSTSSQWNESWPESRALFLFLGCLEFAPQGSNSHLDPFCCYQQLMFWRVVLGWMTDVGWSLS